MQAGWRSAPSRPTAGEKPGRPVRPGPCASGRRQRRPGMTALADPTHQHPTPPTAATWTSFGYGQQLHRSIGSYGSFAAGFSFVSILTTVFQLFCFGFGFGGPAFFWTWPIVFLGQLTRRAVLLRARRALPDLRRDLPVGHPARRRAVGLDGRLADDRRADRHRGGRGDRACRSCCRPSGAASRSSAEPDRERRAAGQRPAGRHDLVNAVGVRAMSVINSVGVTCELVGVMLLCIALFSHAERGPGVVLHTGDGRRRTARATSGRSSSPR